MMNVSGDGGTRTCSPSYVRPRLILRWTEMKNIFEVEYNQQITLTTRADVSLLKKH